MSSALNESQIACSEAGSAQARKPLSRASHGIPRRCAWRLAHSWALRHTLTAYGAYPHTLMNAGPPVSIDEIDVVVIDVHGVPVEGEVNPTSIDLLGGSPGLGLLLRYTH